MSNFGLSTPSIDSKGDFNVNKPANPIRLDQYGLLPQLFWLDKNACFPTSITNALAGMATSYKKPELLVRGVDKNDQLLNTMNSLAKNLETNVKGAGTSETMYEKGIKDYFLEQRIPNEVSVEWKRTDKNSKTFFRM